MFKISNYVISTIAVMAASISKAFAGVLPMPISLGDPLSTVMPFADSGILGLAAAGVIGGIWLARRKR